MTRARSPQASVWLRRGWKGLVSEEMEEIRGERAHEAVMVGMVM
jgi:hypothetical protein